MSSLVRVKKTYVVTQQAIFPTTLTAVIPLCLSLPFNKNSIFSPNTIRIYISIFLAICFDPNKGNHQALT